MVLSWELSNSLDTRFCTDALEQALGQGVPLIFNTDQGSQFTSPKFTQILEDRGIQISMDGKGRALDNIFVERLWRSLKYEEVYCHAYENMMEAYHRIGRYFEFYNNLRPHQSLNYQTPNEIHFAASGGQKNGPTQEGVSHRNFNGPVAHTVSSDQLKGPILRDARTTGPTSKKNSNPTLNINQLSLN